MGLCCTQALVKCQWTDIKQWKYWHFSKANPQWTHLLVRKIIEVIEMINITLKFHQRYCFYYKQNYRNKINLNLFQKKMAISEYYLTKHYKSDKDNRNFITS